MGVYGGAERKRMSGNAKLFMRERDARLLAAFGEDWAPGWNEMGLPNRPEVLPAGDARIQPTAKEVEEVQPDGSKRKRVVFNRETATLMADHLLVRAGYAKAGVEMPRRKLHAMIVKFVRSGMYENEAGELVPGKVTPLPAGQQPRVIVSAGGGGAGKTTVLRKNGLTPETLPHAVTINSDDIKFLLPEFYELDAAGDGRGAEVVHEESSYLAKLVLLQLTDASRSEWFDIVYDATMANGVKSKKLMRGWRAAGFRVELVGVGIDPMEAATRAALRAKHRNRWVPWADLLHAHVGFNEAIADYVGEADDWKYYDNTSNPAVKVAEKNTNGEVEVLDAGRYALVSERAKIQAQVRQASETAGASGGDGLVERDRGERAAGSGVGGSARAEGEAGGRSNARLGARSRPDSGTLDLFSQPAVQAAASSYVATLPAKTKAVVKKAAERDGLGEVADDLFAFASKQADLPRSHDDTKAPRGSEQLETLRQTNAERKKDAAVTIMEAIEAGNWNAVDLKGLRTFMAWQPSVFSTDDLSDRKVRAWPKLKEAFGVSWIFSAGPRIASRIDDADLELYLTKAKATAAPPVLDESAKPGVPASPPADTPAPLDLRALYELKSRQLREQEQDGAVDARLVDQVRDLERALGFDTGNEVEIEGTPPGAADSVNERKARAADTVATVLDKQAANGREVVEVGAPRAALGMRVEDEAVSRYLSRHGLENDAAARREIAQLATLKEDDGHSYTQGDLFGAPGKISCGGGEAGDRTGAGRSPVTRGAAWPCARRLRWRETGFRASSRSWCGAGFRGSTLSQNRPARGRDSADCRKRARGACVPSTQFPRPWVAASTSASAAAFSSWSDMRSPGCQRPATPPA